MEREITTLSEVANAAYELFKSGQLSHSGKVQIDVFPDGTARIWMGDDATSRLLTWGVTVGQTPLTDERRLYDPLMFEDGKPAPPPPPAKPFFFRKRQ